MAHIKIPDDLPGIRGLMAFRSETARPLNKLVDALLQQPPAYRLGSISSCISY